jgi:hypothetical protein
MMRTWLVVGAVAVVLAVAAADALRDATGHRPDARADPGATHAPGESDPGLPPPGALPGRVYFERLDDCALEALDLASMKRVPGLLETRCGLWISPDGASAIVALDRPMRLASREIWFARLGASPVLVRRIGRAAGGVSWSPDGARVAWCRSDGQTVALSLRDRRREHIPGCRPVFAEDGSVLTRPDAPLTGRLLRDGELLLDEAELERGFDRSRPGIIDVLGYEMRADGLLAVAVVRFSGAAPEVVLELWRGKTLEASIPLPLLGSPAGSGRFGEVVRFSPSGGEVAVAFPGAGVRLVLVDVVTGRLVLPPTSQHGTAWSPDGVWFALSTGEEILVYGPGRSAPVYRLPLGAWTIAWV